MMDDLPAFGGMSLADLIGSRLCHDLSNPLGAIGNGVELLEMTGGGTGPELELIRDAVRDAQARVRFFRLAFGQAGKEQITSAREVQGAVAALYDPTRFDVTWAAEADLPRRRVKLGCLMLLCAEAAMPMGGTVRLTCDAARHWTLTAEAPRLRLDDAVWPVLRFGPGAAGRPLKPAEVQFAALQEASEGAGLTVNYVAEPAEAEDGPARLRMATA